MSADHRLNSTVANLATIPHLHVLHPTNVRRPVDVAEVQLLPVLALDHAVRHRIDIAPIVQTLLETVMGESQRRLLFPLLVDDLQALALVAVEVAASAVVAIVEVCRPSLTDLEVLQSRNVVALRVTVKNVALPGTEK